MQPGQLDRLRRQGLIVTLGTLQGLPVLLLVLALPTVAVLSCAPTPAHAKTGAAPKPRPSPAAGIVGSTNVRKTCHIKRPPRRPFRS